MCAVLTAAAVAVTSLPSSAAHAQASVTTPPKADPLSADFKGMVGVGLIGAELGLVIPAAAGLSEVWSFIAFPVVGAAGGAAAGYFLLEKGDHAEVSVASLTLGMALVIPAVLLTAALTAYDPSEEELASAAASQAVAMARAEAARARAADPRNAGMGLVRVAEGGVAVAAPGLSVTPAVRGEHIELAEAQLSLLSGRF